jgi:hypothetical protein
MKGEFVRFAGLQGSENFEALKSGRMEYFGFHLRKPE